MLIITLNRAIFYIQLAIYSATCIPLDQINYNEHRRGAEQNITECQSSPIPALVDLGYTQYQGVSLEAGVNHWLGMRYAAPPVGELRWRKPQDPPVNQSVQGATKFGAVCIGMGQTVSDSTAEDCLFVDVFAPSNATINSKLPVWFFIQGGGYALNSDQNFNATEVIVKSNFSMVFVQINYGVGVFGFLASEKIRANGSLNVGLLDQPQALQWTQKYIRFFGGDPEHIVIHGDSAGAGSIAHQLSAYGDRDDNLFVGAIAESTFWPTQMTVSEAEFQFDRFVANVNSANASDQLVCLRSKDTASLQAANVLSPFPGASAHPDFYFLPVIDGNFSQDRLYNLYEQGKFVKVPSIVGDDTDEATEFSPNATTSAQFLQFIKNNYPKLTDGDLQSINETYPLVPEPVFPHHAPYFTPTEQAYGEATFICPGIQMSSSIAAYLTHSKSWNYRYNVYDDVLESEGLGVPHVSEQPAIYGLDNTKACNNCSYVTYNAPIVPIVMNYWISFIVSLDPNTSKDPTAPEWGPWGTQGGQRIKIELNATEMEVVPTDQLQRCAMWKKLANVTEQ